MVQPSAPRKTLRGSVFVLTGFALTACTPNLAIEPLALDVDERAVVDETAVQPSSLIPEIAPPPAEAPRLRKEPENGYLLIRRRLRSTTPKRVQQGLALAKQIEDTMFPDRIALLEGQAYERLGNLAEAKGAYLRAIGQAGAPAVREQAARGMISVLGAMGDHTTRLEYIDALIESIEKDEPDWHLNVLRAQTLHKLGRKDEARAALRTVLEEHPTLNAVASAERVLLEVEGRKKLSKSDERLKTLGRVRWLGRTGRVGPALATLRQWQKKNKRLDPEASLLEIDLLIKRGQRSKAQEKLTDLAKSRNETLRAGATLRLARIAAFRFQYRKARELFQEVIDKFPGSPAAIDAEFEAAQIEYDSDQYEAASRKMRAFVERHRDERHGTKAVWLAGFTAHLIGSSTVAIAIFERFLAEEPDHPTAPRARYWLARELEIMGERERAAEMYSGLIERTPLGFYGLLAEQRLQSMGVSAALDPLPPVPSPQTIEEVVALLGPERPIGVDRAAALFEARLNREGTEELLGLAEHFRKSGDTQGATLVVDLFQMFGKDAWAFLLARQIAEADKPDDLERRPYYWRVWRHAFPKPFEDEVRLASNDNRVDPFLVYSVMRTESLFRPDSVSVVGARGLMQLMPATARWIGKKDRRAKPHAKRYQKADSNIWLGSWYIRFLLDHYQGDVTRVLGAYNAGPAALDRWGRRFQRLEPDEFIERIPYDETRAYVRRAMESYLVYQRLHQAPSVAQTEEPRRSRGS